MGAFAARWQRQHDLTPIALLSGMRFFPVAKTLLITTYEPDAEELCSSFGTFPAWIALPDPPTRPLPGVRYTTFGQVGELMAQGQVHQAVLDLPTWQWRPRVLLQLHQQGLRRCWGPWGVLNTRALAYARGGMILARRWWNRCRWPVPPGQMELYAQWLRSVPNRTGPSSRSSRVRIVHYMRLCSLGGTERQVALLARAQRQAGHEVRTFAQMAALGERRTCHPWFAESHVPLRVAGSRWQPEVAARWRIPPRLLRSLPGEMRNTVLDLVGELLAQPADVLHCWGDEPNIAGLIAAKLAGVPAVVQSSTGLSPHSYPATLQPWMQPWYQAGLSEPQVALACISEAGIADYANWLELPAQRVHLLRIAVEEKPFPTRADGLAWRRQQGIPEDSPVLVGLFRLEPGKRPLLFLEIAAAVKKVIPALQVILIGSGSLESQVQRAISRLSLDGTVRLLGQPADVLTPLAGSDVMLLVSEAEGTPVSVLEAQLTGCVPVVTDVGGCRETVADGQTGFVLPSLDRVALIAAVCRLLEEMDLRRRMAAAGPGFVRQRFALERMAAESFQLYQYLLANQPRAVQREAEAAA